MSRASSIWLVMDNYGAIKAAFTVRHEMVAWLHTQYGTRTWAVWQFPDGVDKDRLPARIEIRDLLT